MTAASEAPTLHRGVPMDLAGLQAAIAERDLDGWLLYDFRDLNPIARRLAGFAEDAHHSRRWFGWIPRRGEPLWLHHAIEAHLFADRPGRKRAYVGWRDLEASLGAMLEGAKRVAMEYSPGAAIPTVSRVDAGTLELVRGLGPEVVSSADLVAAVEAVWSEAGLESHRRAAAILGACARDAHAHVTERARAGLRLDEDELQARMVEFLRGRGLRWEGDPIVASGPHAANPHHTPRRGAGDRIEPEQVLLLDLWGRLEGEGTISADITWMAFVGRTVPDEVGRVWEAVREARDAAVRFLVERHERGEPTRGYEVDDVARGVVRERGHEPRFLHRLGHSIGTAVHGNGANLDHLETRDERRLLPRTGFSIEPGVYLEGRFGVRSEIDCYLGEAGPEVTTPVQDSLPALLA